MRIFISHSSNDRELAKSLVDLLLRALPLNNTDILCTSVAGHGLTVGDNQTDRIRHAVDEADVLIGVLTPASLRSTYVVFELGARWGVNKPLYPILACGIRPESLEAPLSSIHCLDAADDSALHGLIETLGSLLNLDQHPPSTYTGLLGTFRSLAEVIDPVTEDNPTIVYPDLSDAAAELLLAATDDGAPNPGLVIVISSLGGKGIQAGALSVPHDPSDAREEARWIDAFKELVEYGLVDADNPDSDVHRITTRGYDRADELRRVSAES